MKKIVALFSVLAMFSLAAFAQDPPKKSGKKKPNAAKVSTTKVKKATKVKVAHAKMNTK